MNKKMLTSVVVTFIISMALGFFIHGMLLHDEYAQFPNLFRTKEDSANYFGYMLLAHVMMAVAFVWIYLKGKSDKPYLGQGIRYGIAIAVLMTVPTYLIYYAVQPMPGAVVFKQIVFDTIGVLLMGVVVARLNK